MSLLNSAAKELQVIYSNQESAPSVLSSPAPVLKEKEKVPILPQRNPVVESKPIPAPVIAKNKEEVKAPAPPVEVIKKPQEVVAPPKSKTPEKSLKEFPAHEENQVLEKQEIKSKSSIISSFALKDFRKNPTTEEPRVFYHDLKQRPLPSQKFKAQLLAGDTEQKVFSIIDITNEPILKAIESTIDEVTCGDNSGTSYSPKKDEVVLAKFEGTFYRGWCKERKDGGFLIHYIDYGNVAIVPEQGLKKLHKKLQDFDVVVHQCFMENFPDEITSKVAEILSQEDGVIIQNATQGTKDATYVARIFGLWFQIRLLEVLFVKVKVKEHFKLMLKILTQKFTQRQ